MFAMFTRIFSSISVWFMAFEKLGSAANHIGTWTDESAGAFADEARIQRQAKMHLMLKEQRANEANEKQLTSLTDQTA
jgi:hypothetical protein